MEGVACMTVAPEEASRAARSPASDAAAREATTTRAPTASGRSSSSAAMSKESVVTASRTSAGDRPGRARMECRKLTSARCGTTTPLGFPVDPEV